MLHVLPHLVCAGKFTDDCPSFVSLSLPRKSHHRPNFDRNIASRLALKMFAVTATMALGVFWPCFYTAVPGR